jgi:hypothetical protein
MDLSLSCPQNNNHKSKDLVEVEQLKFWLDRVSFDRAVGPVKRAWGGLSFFLSRYLTVFLIWHAGPAAK